MPNKITTPLTIDDKRTGSPSTRLRTDDNEDKQEPFVSIGQRAASAQQTAPRGRRIAVFDPGVEIAKGVAHTHVVFNNDLEEQGQRNARTLMSFLSDSAVAPTL